MSQSMAPGTHTFPVPQNNQEAMHLRLIERGELLTKE